MLCIFKVYLLFGLVYKGAAFLQMRREVSLWKVQDLKRLIDHLIWKQVGDSVGHI